jgi:hypothetical protein
MTGPKKVPMSPGSSSLYCIFRGNLIEQYHQAKAAYASTVSAAKRLHGKDFYEAQLRVMDAHIGFERAWQDLLDQRGVVH